ncbi:MAG: hypothetical protein RIS29_1383 [Bacteroidota bacterium]|jgi:hypothetical protein
MKFKKNITSEKVNIFRKIALNIVLLAFTSQVLAQTDRTVTPALTSIELTSDAHLGGMADISSVASDFYPEAGLSHNPALLINETKHAGLNFSNMPMYTKIAKDINNKSMNAFYAIDSKNVIGYSFSKFDLGEQILTDYTGTYLSTIHQGEYYHKLSYARSISQNIALGLGLKVINSNMETPEPINTIAADLGFSFRKKFTLSKEIDLGTNLGSTINNLGSKVENSEFVYNYFMPTNLKIGLMLSPAYHITSDINLNWDVAIQFRKDLIPSQETHKNYNNISSFQAFYQSFYDSPDGFIGEIKEINSKIGTEVRINYINKLYLALRYGRYNTPSIVQHDLVTSEGLGIGVYGFYLDLKYLKPHKESNLNDNHSITLGCRLKLNGKPFEF